MANFRSSSSAVMSFHGHAGALLFREWPGEAAAVRKPSGWIQAFLGRPTMPVSGMGEPLGRRLWPGGLAPGSALGVDPWMENREQLIEATDYVDSLVQEALQHPAVHHPYLHDLAAGRLPNLRQALHDFAQQYYGYSAHFPRFLTALISRLEQPAHRAALVANLTEESGQYEAPELAELSALGIDPRWIVGIPHPELFQRFREAMGVGHSGEAQIDLEVVCWREQVLALLSGSSAAEAVGALGLGTETIVPVIYQPFVAAVEALGLAPRDRVFFLLHTAVDDHHQATLRQIAIDCAATPQGRLDLAKGMRKALALRHSFWSWLHQRALQCAPLSEAHAS